MITYTIFDSITKQTSGAYKTWKSAESAVNRKNNTYGSYRYFKREVTI